MFGQPEGRQGRVTGIDPGLSRCGIGTIESATRAGPADSGRDSRRGDDTRSTGIPARRGAVGAGAGRGMAASARVLRAEVVRTGSDMAHGDRLATIDAALRTAVAEDRPAALAVERVFLNRQKVTGIGALQVVGLVHLLGATLGLPVIEYTPSQVKAAVTGVGDADKDQVGFMVARMLGLDEVPKPADRADALAVALCHLCRPVWEEPAGPRPSRGAADPTAGLPPRLAAALADAGPGLSAVRRPGGTTP